MKYMSIVLLLFFGTLLLLPGCAGYDRMLFFTKTNVGLDLDTTPATVDATVARREGVIAPTFEEAKTPPVLASFRSDQSGFFRFFTGIASSFAVGDAAETMAELYDERDSDESADSSLHLMKKPSGGFWKPEPFEVDDDEGFIAPLIFGTDSSFGLKVAWSGTGMGFSTLRFGFNRKELAWAPVTLSERSGEENGYKYTVKVPSLLATVDNTSTLGKLYSRELGATGNGGGGEFDIQYLQFFATGKAATNLAKKKQIRQVMLARMDPDYLPDEKMYHTLVQVNRDLAEDLVEKTGELDSAVKSDRKKLTSLYRAAVGLGYIDPISDFKEMPDLSQDEQKAEELKTAIVKPLEQRAQRDLNSTIYTDLIKSLLMVLE